MAAMIGISARPVSRAALDKIHRSPYGKRAKKYSKPGLIFSSRLFFKDTTMQLQQRDITNHFKSEAAATEADKLLRDALKKAVKVEWP